MSTQFEKRYYLGDSKVWIGKYKDLVNLPHRHNDCEIVLVERGEATLFIDGTEYAAKTGDGFFISSARPHYIQAEKESILSFILFDRAFLEDFPPNLSLATPRLSCQRDVAAAYAALAEEFKTQKPFRNIAVKQILTALLLKIFREETTALQKETLSRDDRYQQLLSEIDENYSFYTFSDAARFMGFSEPYFSKYFRKRTGMPFAKYLNAVRVKKAIRLLKKDRSLKFTDIAAQCGFNTIRNFNRVFKSITGFSPHALPENYDDALPLSEQTPPFNPTDEKSELLPS
jgi:AraC-like DNA-binding protein